MENESSNCGPRTVDLTFPFGSTIISERFWPLFSLRYHIFFIQDRTSAPSAGFTTEPVSGTPFLRTEPVSKTSGGGGGNAGSVQSVLARIQPAPTGHRPSEKKNPLAAFAGFGAGRPLRRPASPAAAAGDPPHTAAHQFTHFRPSGSTQKEETSGNSNSHMQNKLAIFETQILIFQKF